MGIGTQSHPIHKHHTYRKSTIGVKGYTSTHSVSIPANA